MEYAMRIIIPVGEQIFCSWLFHGNIILIRVRVEWLEMFEMFEMFEGFEEFEGF